MRFLAILLALTALPAVDAAAQGIVHETVWDRRRPQRHRPQRIRLAEHSVKE